MSDPGIPAIHGGEDVKCLDCGIREVLAVLGPVLVLRRGGPAPAGDPQ
jgi:hypothetical protein